MNFWPKHNLMIFDTMMINVQIKQAIDLEYKKNQFDKDFSPRLINYKICQMNKISLDRYNKAKQ